ncbi:MAG: D-2-hydroxyacid dehydrogenase [Pseudomonadota bacterium]
MKTPRLMLHTDAPELALEVVAARHPDLAPTVCADFESLAEAVAREQPEVVYSSNFAPAPFPRAPLMETEVAWVSNAGSGVNHLMPWDPARVTVTNSAGVAAEAMAQYALGMMLHFSLDVPGLQSDQAARVWAARRIEPLWGKTLAIIGLGKTGAQTAIYASALGMEVLGVRARPQPTPSVAEVFATSEMDKALARADFVLLCLPLLETTRGLFDAKALVAMKPGAVLVDVSRGGILVEADLMDALDQGRLGGVALDVTSPEPLPAESPLWARPEVLISPHCSGVWPGWERRSLEMFAENLHRWRRGDPLRNVVDPARGY